MFKVFENTDPVRKGFQILSSSDGPTCHNYCFEYVYRGLREYGADKLILKQMCREAHSQKDALTRSMMLWMMGANEKALVLPCHDGTGSMDPENFAEVLKSMITMTNMTTHAKADKIKEMAQELCNIITMDKAEVGQKIQEVAAERIQTEAIGTKTAKEEGDFINKGGDLKRKGVAPVDNVLKDHDKTTPDDPNGEPDPKKTKTGKDK